ncbi:unnamed protein product [Caenorhabditis auriculariae]|uniref:Uncharacterized protein n=1 Tax=Caenorhabditis auriculariae TaxID=2777116 RepID=A0A8S1HG29_9PELO|nr:unnamed protein product [Caenorhabditis auriculariae]
MYCKGPKKNFFPSQEIQTFRKSCQHPLFFGGVGKGTGAVCPASPTFHYTPRLLFGSEMGLLAGELLQLQSNRRSCCASSQLLHHRNLLTLESPCNTWSAGPGYKVKMSRGGNNQNDGLGDHMRPMKPQMGFHKASAYFSTLLYRWRGCFCRRHDGAICGFAPCGLRLRPSATTGAAAEQQQPAARDTERHLVFDAVVFSLLLGLTGSDLLLSEIIAKEVVVRKRPVHTQVFFGNTPNSTLHFPVIRRFRCSTSIQFQPADLTLTKSLEPKQEDNGKPIDGCIEKGETASAHPMTLFVLVLNFWMYLDQSGPVQTRFTDNLAGHRKADRVHRNDSCKQWRGGTAGGCQFVARLIQIGAPFCGRAERQLSMHTQPFHRNWCEEFEKIVAASRFFSLTTLTCDDRRRLIRPSAFSVAVRLINTHSSWERPISVRLFDRRYQDEFISRFEITISGFFFSCQGFRKEITFSMGTSCHKEVVLHPDLKICSNNLELTKRTRAKLEGRRFADPIIIRKADQLAAGANMSSGKKAAIVSATARAAVTSTATWLPAAVFGLAVPPVPKGALLLVLIFYVDANLPFFCCRGWAYTTSARAFAALSGLEEQVFIWSLIFGRFRRAEGSSEFDLNIVKPELLGKPHEVIQEFLEGNPTANWLPTREDFE